MKSFTKLSVCCVLMFLQWRSVNTLNTCTHHDDFPFLQRDMRLPGYTIVAMTVGGLMTCARNCLARKWCKSFNFDSSSRECELNYARLSPGGLNHTHLVAAADVVFSDVSDWPVKLAGVCANHTCPINTYCDPQNDNLYTCIAYVKPTSCAEVKECDPTSTDGEYWIRLVNFDLYRTRIYCHDMSSDTPTEYLTLPNPNYGIYPPVTNPYCSSESALKFGCTGKGGEKWFYKIKVDLENMNVDRGDTTFANFTNYINGYAQAEDCYARHNNGILSSCGTKGRFTVDLTGTGWAVHPEQKWTVQGYKFIIESITRNDKGTIIEMKCGGYDGYCYPDGYLVLVPTPTAELQFSLFANTVVISDLGLYPVVGIGQGRVLCQTVGNHVVTVNLGPLEVKVHQSNPVFPHSAGRVTLLYFSAGSWFDC